MNLMSKIFFEVSNDKSMTSLAIINCLNDGISQMRSLDIEIKNGTDEQYDVLKLAELINNSKSKGNVEFLSELVENTGKFATDARWWILDSDISGDYSYLDCLL